MKIIGIGAGGHSAVILDAIERAGEHEVVGLLDRTGEGEAAGIAVIGTDLDLAAMRGRGVDGFFMGIGSVGDAGPRRAAFDRAVAAGLEPVVVVHPAAVVAASAVLGPGTVVLAGAVVNPGARIGRNVIVNTGAIVEHHAEIGDHAHVAPRAVLGGDVSVGVGAHIGIGATTMQGVRIGDGAIVAAGAVVVRDVEAATVVAGVPAAPLVTTSRKRMR